jgi:hypothetical protein
MSSSDDDDDDDIIIIVSNLQNRKLKYFIEYDAAVFYSLLVDLDRPRKDLTSTSVRISWKKRLAISLELVVLSSRMNRSSPPY